LSKSPESHEIHRAFMRNFREPAGYLATRPAKSPSFREKSHLRNSRGSRKCASTKFGKSRFREGAREEGGGGGGGDRRLGRVYLADIYIFSRKLSFRIFFTKRKERKKKTRKKSGPRFIRGLSRASAPPPLHPDDDDDDARCGGDAGGNGEARAGKLDVERVETIGSMPRRCSYRHGDTERNTQSVTR